MNSNDDEKLVWLDLETTGLDSDNNMRGIFEHNILEIGIHITPSLIEGFGHYINEARIVGATILTSNYPPMNELVNKECGVLVNCSKLLIKRNKSKICYINENDLLKGITKIISMSDQEKEKLGENAYNSYIKEKKYFTKRMNLLIDKLSNKNKKTLS